MPLPSFVAAGAVAFGPTPVTVNYPAGIQANDILLLMTENNLGGAPTATGFTLVGSMVATTGGASNSNTKLANLWQRYVSGTSVSVASTSSDHILARIIAIRGCITTGDPWDVLSGAAVSASDTSWVAAGATTTVANCLVLGVGTVTTDTVTPQFSGWANASLASITERTNDATTQADGGGLACFTGEKATAGVYGNSTATLATTSKYTYQTIAFKSASTVETTFVGAIPF